MGQAAFNSCGQSVQSSSATSCFVNATSQNRMPGRHTAYVLIGRQSPNRLRTSSGTVRRRSHWHARGSGGRCQEVNRPRHYSRSVTVMVTGVVGFFRGIDSPAPLFSSSDVKSTIFFLLWRGSISTKSLKLRGQMLISAPEPTSLQISK